MFSGLQTTEDEHLAAYFTPTKETVIKQQLQEDTGIFYDENEEYEYKLTREYDWNVKSKRNLNYKENYFFIESAHRNAYYYNELETHVRLSRRKQTSIECHNNTK